MNLTPTPQLQVGDFFKLCLAMKIEYEYSGEPVLLMDDS